MGRGSLGSHLTQGVHSLARRMSAEQLLQAEHFGQGGLTANPLIQQPLSCLQNRQGAGLGRADHVWEAPRGVSSMAFALKKLRVRWPG